MRRRRFLIEGLALPGAALAAGVPWPRWPIGLRATDDRFEEVASLLTRLMEEHGIPGAALGVVKDGVRLVRGFGVTSVEAPQPVTPDTIFELASLSKTFTATAIARLATQGRLDLEAPVERYLPGFRVLDAQASREVTIAHLISHTPGWEGQLGTEDVGVETLARFAASMAELPQLAATGAVWSYNNAGFALAGRVIEVVHGKDIHQSLKDLVFAPLGLERASTRAVDIMTYPVALGHRGAPGAPQIIRPFSMGSSPTAGGVSTSVSELLAFAHFHLGGPPGADALPAQTLSAMRAPRARKEPTGDSMGLGWHLRSVGGVATAAHGGTAGAGHRLLLELVPERNLAFTVLTNHVDGWKLIQAVERATLRIYEGLALAPNQPIGHRGVNEDMRAHATALAEQPALAPYLGAYARAPLAGYQAREQNGRLAIGAAGAAGGTEVTFYGADVAFSSADGLPYEFIRDANGRVGWVRVNGRIAKKETG